MFENTGVESLDLSSFDTLEVTDMSGMFQNTGVESLDLSSFNTLEVTNMSSMFQDNSNLISLNISNFDTQNVRNMSSMFQNTGVESLNLYSFNTLEVIDMSSMFQDNPKLTQLIIHFEYFNTQNVTDMSGMFQNTGVASLDLSSFNTQNVTDMSGMFQDNPNLTILDFAILQNFNTQNVTNMSSMFQNTGVARLDLSCFDTLKVTDMSSMFENNSNLISLNISHFNTSLQNNVTLERMLQDCTNLKRLIMTDFDTSGVESMQGMFSGCSSLEYLYFPSRFVGNSLMNLHDMFDSCVSLKEIIFPDTFYFPRLQETFNLQNMFKDCTSLQKISLTGMEYFPYQEGVFSGITQPIIIDVGKDFIFRAIMHLDPSFTADNFTFRSMHQEAIFWLEDTKNGYRYNDTTLENTKNAFQYTIEHDDVGFSGGFDQAQEFSNYSKSQLKQIVYSFKSTTLKAVDAEQYAQFGRSMAIDGDTFVVGAYGDDSSTGAVYIYTRNDYDEWTEQKLKPSDAQPYDYFGWSVAIDGDTLVVGAYGDDNNEPNSGAAYIYTRDGEGTWTDQPDVLKASDAAEKDLFGYSVAIDGDTLVVGAYGSGAAYIYTRNDGTWTVQNKLAASDGQQYDYFGWSVAIDGDTVVVGASGDDNNSGAAYIYTRNNGTWTEQKKLKAGDAASGDYFGFSVAIDGNTVVVGAYGDDNNSGAVYIYTRNDCTWRHSVKFKASDGDRSDYFGWSVAIDGDTLVVGAHGDDNNGTDSGAAYIYTRNNGTWNEQKKLKAGDAQQYERFGYSVAIDDDTVIVGSPFNTGAVYTFSITTTLTTTLNSFKSTTLKATRQPNANFGRSVAIDGDTFVVGAPYENNTGAVYIYTRNNGTWIDQPDVLKASEVEQNDYFLSSPYSVAIDSDTLVVGAYSDGTNSGAAYIYTRNGEDTWTDQPDVLKASDGDPNDYFGWSVAIDGDTVVVGAYGDENNTGAAYIYTRNNNDEWTEQKLKPSDAQQYDYFGGSVAIDGDTLVVGAIGDDNNGTNSGAAYIYTRDGEGTWTDQPDVLKASDAEQNDLFGYSVAIDGDTVVVGAPDIYNTENNTGAAYIYTRNGEGTWSHSAKLEANNAEQNDFLGYSVAIDSDTVVVGAYGDDNDTGAAYIFTRDNGDTWTKRDELRASDAQQYDQLGYSVAIDCDTVVVGAYGDDNNSGAVYMFSSSLNFTIFSPIENNLKSLFENDRFYSINSQKVDTSEVISTRDMFKNCHIYQLGIEGFDIRKVIDASGMFEGVNKSLRIQVGEDFVLSQYESRDPNFCNKSDSFTFVPTHYKSYDYLSSIKSQYVYSYNIEQSIDFTAEAGADPYIQPVFGNLYKLPDTTAYYRLLQSENIIVNIAVKQVEQTYINNKLRNLTDTHFTSKTYDEDIFSWTNMYFFTELCIICNDEIACINLLDLSSIGNIPDWLIIHEIIDSETSFAMYNNEKCKSMQISIDDTIYMKLTSYDNPQVMSAIKLEKSNCMIDGLLRQMYSSNSALINSIYDNQVCHFKESHTNEYVKENFYTNNNTNVSKEILVV